MSEQPAPQSPRRSTARLTIGIVLTVLGGLALLGQLSSQLSGSATVPEDAAGAAGYLFGALLVVLVVPAIGIWLIATSKRKP